MTLEVRDVTLTVAGKTLLRDFSFNVSPGNILTIMGGSGCGKSSLLGFICGTLSRSFKSSGSVLLNGRDITSCPAYQRHIGLQFQDHSLFPHMTVGENLAFGIPACCRKTERARRVEEALADCGLQGFASYNPANLSGGQKARISLMRTLLSEPAALLMDEPFSKLDHRLKTGFREFVFNQIADRSIPALMVTHDQEDIACQSLVVDI